MSDPDLHISGGAGGTYARYADLALLADHSDDLAVSLARVSAECHAMLADPDVLASALLHPAGVAKFEAALLGALDGPGGLSALAVGYAERAVALRAVAASYETVDEAQRRAIDGIRWTLGYAAAGAAPAGLLLAASPIGLLTLAGLGAPLVGYELAGGDLDYERLLTDHPGLVDEVVGAAPGVLSALPGLFVGDVAAASHLLGTFYPDGKPHIKDLGLDDDEQATRPPAGVGDLIEGLDYRNRVAHSQDMIDVRTIVRPDGGKAHIVDIPGTKDWNLPGQLNPALNDLGTNVHILGGDTTARERAVADALRMAGAGPNDPVMLVGHSQGGMLAAQAAHDSATGDFPYRVTHVMTAGSPIGRVDIPADVQVLALENSHDIVPHLDAADNRDRPNITTVTFDSQNGTIGNNHGTAQSYVPAAHALDASTDPSVTAFRDSAGAFLAPDATVEAHVYELSREPST